MSAKAAETNVVIGWRLRILRTDLANAEAFYVKNFHGPSDPIIVCPPKSHILSLLIIWLILNIFLNTPLGENEVLS